MINSGADFISKLRFNLSFILCQCGVGILDFSFLRFKDRKAIEKVEENLCQLSSSMYEECQVEIDKEDFENCVIIKKEETLYPVNVDNSIKNVDFEEEKVIRYFHLLDRDSQIQVLKHVQSQLLGYGEKLSESNQDQLFLLEEEDEELIDIKKRILVPLDKK